MLKKSAYQRPILKWAGGKYRVLPELLKQFTPAKRFVEAFAGSAVVFLNVDYPSYLICDINQDLIALYKNIQKEQDKFIAECAKLFTAENNTPSRFYSLRETYNKSNDLLERAKLLLYLNKHAYNGLVRYNKSAQYNVPFAHYKKVCFPQKAIWKFCEKANTYPTIFCCQDYQKTFAQLQNGDLIYCDPPYSPLEQSSNFTNYTQNSFSCLEQANLVKLAQKATTQGVTCLISNHDTDETRKLYNQAQIYSITVQRQINCKGTQRKKVAELIAKFA